MFRTIIKIDGMMCNMCESHVNNAIREKLSDIKKVSSSHKKGQTEIISKTAYTEEEIREILDSSGYKVIEVFSEPYKKRPFFSFGK